MPVNYRQRAKNRFAKKMLVQGDFSENEATLEDAAARLKTLRSIVVDMLVLLILVTVVVFIYTETQKETIVIDEFTVPKSFVDSGRDGLFIAALIRDHVNAIRIQADTDWGAEKMTLVSTELPSTDIVVPSTGISLGNLVGMLRDFFNIDEVRIVGKIVDDGPDSLSMFVRTQTESLHRITVGKDELDSMARRTAIYIWRHSAPHLLAQYHRARNEHNLLVELAGKVTRAEGAQPYEVVHNTVGNSYYAMGQYEAALKHYTLVLTSDPEAAYALFNSGLALSAQNLYDHAVKKFEECIATGKAEWHTYEQLAYAYLNLDQPDAAQRSTDQMSEKFKGNAELHHAASQLYLALGDDQAADRQINYAIAIDSTNARFLVALGNIILNLGEPDSSIEWYQKAEQLDSLYLPVYFNWGLALSAQGQRLQAIEKFKQAIALDSLHYPIYASWGLQLHYLGGFQEAVELYEKALEIQPDYGLALLYTANALFGLSEYEKTLDLYAAAAESDSLNTDALHNWGLSLIKLKRYEDAIVKFEKAVQIDPELGSAYVYWAASLEELGRAVEAVAQYENALAVEPENVAAIEALERLRQ